jgi:mono/diheme cytochrome c family protein
MGKRYNSRRDAVLQRPFWQMTALCAVLWVLGAGIYGRMAGFAQTPEPQHPSPSTPERIAKGRELYLGAGCYACHGLEATGRGKQGTGGGVGSAVPAIRHYDGGQEQFLRIVQNGKQGTLMGPFKGILTDEEILSIYQYLISLPR